MFYKHPIREFENGVPPIGSAPSFIESVFYKPDIGLLIKINGGQKGAQQQRMAVKRDKNQAIKKYKIISQSYDNVGLTKELPESHQPCRNTD